jgi:hypothetical protein
MAEPPRLHFTCIAPPNYVDEVVETFMVAARKLGHPVTYARAGVDPHAINVVCFALGLSADALAGIPASSRLVVNFEPLAPGAQGREPDYLELLRRNYVWEYSQSNLRMYPELGIEHGFHVPLGYEEEADLTLAVDDRLPEAERDIDVLFFGVGHFRRDAVLDAMRARGLRVVSNGSTLWSPEERNAHIRRAKVVLNMHRFEGTRIVEMPRLAMLLRQRKAVLCEMYPDSEIAPELRRAVVGAPFDRLVDMAQLMVSSPSLRDELERTGLDLLRQRPHTDSLRPALADFFAWRERAAAGAH